MYIINSLRGAALFLEPLSEKVGLNYFLSDKILHETNNTDLFHGDTSATWGCIYEVKSAPNMGITLFIDH